MAKTKIEWCDYTVNPVKGLCPVGCSYCYARAMYHRFKWNPEIRFDDNWWRGIAVLRKRSRIFVGSTIDLFHPEASKWNGEVLAYCARMPWHTFIFLTKQPENLPKKWPDNCWVGVTATDTESFMRACTLLEYPLQAKVKFLSLEPLLSWDYSWSNSYLANALKRANIGWLIIGQQTPVRASTMPKLGWIQEIVEAADRAGVPVFLKDNLKGLLPEAHPFCTFPWDSDPEAGASVLRQEFPK